MSYSDLLQMLTRRELYDIVRALEIPGYSQAAKGELVEIIASSVPARVLLPLLSNAALRELLRELEEKSSGTKATLVERLLGCLDLADDDDDDPCDEREPAQRLAWALLEVLDRDTLHHVALDRLGDPDVTTRWGARRTAREIARYDIDSALAALYVPELRAINEAVGACTDGRKAELIDALSAWIHRHEDDEDDEDEEDETDLDLDEEDTGDEFDQDAGTLHEEDRVKALLIGNGGYPGRDRLNNPTKDVEDLARLLRRLGHEVQEHTDLKGKRMKRVLRAFAKGLDDDDKVLVYFSGHGMECQGENYLLPVDFDGDCEADLEYDAMPVSRVLKTLKDVRLRVVILDACRSNSFRALIRGSNMDGLQAMLVPKADGAEGTLLCFATAPGTVALDGRAGTNGVYTEALLRHLDDPGLVIEEVCKQVRREVVRATDGDQVPWENSSLTGDWFPAGRPGHRN